MLVLLSLCLFSLASALVLPQSPFQLAPFSSLSGVSASHHATSSRVPVTLGVMSHCPDARFCESVFDEVLEEVRGLVDLKMEYIGTVNPSSPQGATCMHGPSECIENIDQLCAYRHWKTSGEGKEPWSDWWEFVQCLNRNPSNDGSSLSHCAEKVGHDWSSKSAVYHCANSGEGVQLLQQSIARTQSIGVRKSCTIVIDSKPVCVHDSEWKECSIGHKVEDFVQYIEKEWKKRNP